MSKSANAGELRTKVYFFGTAKEIDDEGFTQTVKVNPFGEGVAVKCKWKNAHGSEVFTAMQLQLRDPATLTCRYSPKITQQLSVVKCSDNSEYDIVSIDNVEERNEWLEIKVQRKEAAK